MKEYDVSQPCVDMSKDQNGEFVHHPEDTRFYDPNKPEVVLIETRCSECALILNTKIILKTEDETD